MTKSCRLIQINAALPSVVERSGVAELPQLTVHRNTKSDPNLVETLCVARHRLSLDGVERSSFSEV